MIPSTSILTDEITEVTYANRTYRVVFAHQIAKTHSLGTNGTNALDINSNDALSGFTVDENGVVNITYNVRQAGYELTQDDVGILGLAMVAELAEADRISGYVDGIDAVIQTVYFILSTERFKYTIYSWDYGVELVDLFGQPMPYVMAELPERITEALTQDNRIESVTDFEFERHGRQLRVTFSIVTNIGNISTALEVGV